MKNGWKWKEKYENSCHRSRGLDCSSLVQHNPEEDRSETECMNKFTFIISSDFPFYKSLSTLNIIQFSWIFTHSSIDPFDYPNGHTSIHSTILFPFISLLQVRISSVGYGLAVSSPSVPYSAFRFKKVWLWWIIMPMKINDKQLLPVRIFSVKSPFIRSYRI